MTCQGLQSCLEPQSLEPRVVMNNTSSPPKSNSPQSMLQKPPQEEQEEEHNRHENGGGLSFLQCLDNPKNVVVAKEEIYIHPLVKSSFSSTMNAKSLEMCTESLGSETGSDISENMDDPSSFSPENYTSRDVQRSNCRHYSKKLERKTNFPPPLTSISGRDNIQVRPHREDGRLILKAVTITQTESYFKAERADGRLILSLKTDSTTIHYEQDEYENCEESEIQDVVYEHEKGGAGDDCLAENGGRKLASEIAMLSRCKESGSRNKGIQSWGQVWVAIS